MRFAHREDLLRTVEEPVAQAWLTRSDHTLVAASGPYILLERGRHPRNGLGARALIGRADPERGLGIASCVAVRSARLAQLSLVIDLVARSACPADLAIRFGSGWKPSRVDLLFGGQLSPAHLQRGDIARSVHVLTRREARSILAAGLRVGTLRSSGARPEPTDPIAVNVPLSHVESGP